MQVLLSTIGSRGDVQPLVALAQQLMALGQDIHLCVPPDFQDWIESLGMSVTPIGPEVRSTGKARPSSPRCTINTTGHNESISSASELRMHPAHRPPPR